MGVIWNTDNSRIFNFMIGGIEMKVLVETSAHHIHVTDETLETLFGKGAS